MKNVELNCHHSKSKTGDIRLMANSPSTRLPACVIFSFGTTDNLFLRFYLKDLL